MKPFASPLETFFIRRFWPEPSRKQRMLRKSYFYHRRIPYYFSLIEICDVKVAVSPTLIRKLSMCSDIFIKKKINSALYACLPLSLFFCVRACMCMCNSILLLHKTYLEKLNKLMLAIKTKVVINVSFIVIRM